MRISDFYFYFILFFKEAFFFFCIKRNRMNEVKNEIVTVAVFCFCLWLQARKEREYFLILPDHWSSAVQFSLHFNHLFWIIDWLLIETIITFHHLSPLIFFKKHCISGLFCLLLVPTWYLKVNCYNNRVYLDQFFFPVFWNMDVIFCFLSNWILLVSFLLLHSLDRKFKISLNIESKSIQLLSFLKVMMRKSH